MAICTISQLFFRAAVVNYNRYVLPRRHAYVSLFYLLTELSCFFFTRKTQHNNELIALMVEISLKFKFPSQSLQNRIVILHS